MSPSIKNYSTLPLVIEAVELVEENLDFLTEWAGLEIVEINPDTDVSGYQYLISTLEGVMEAQLGDFIIKGLRGEFYPCKPDVFKKKYAEIK